jgi:hypothetical protein
MHYVLEEEANGFGRTGGADASIVSGMLDAYRRSEQTSTCPGARDGKPVFSFGSGDTALHFASLGGPVVMDSVDLLPVISGRH